MSLLKPFSNLLKRAKASLQSLLPQKDPVSARLDSELAKNTQAQRQAATLTPNQTDATLLRMEYATIGALDPLQFVRDGMMILNSPQKAANARTVAALTTKALQDEPNNRALQRLLDESHLQLDRNICNRIAGLHTLSRTDKAKALSENLRDAHTLIQTGAPKATREDAYTDIARTVDLLMKTDPAAGKQEVAYLSKQPYFKNVMNKAKDLFKDRPIESARYTPRAESDLAPEAQPKANLPKEPAPVMMTPFFAQLHDRRLAGKFAGKFNAPDTLPKMQENGQLPGMHVAEASLAEFDKLMARMRGEGVPTLTEVVNARDLRTAKGGITVSYQPPEMDGVKVYESTLEDFHAVTASFERSRRPDPAKLAILPMLTEVLTGLDAQKFEKAVGPFMQPPKTALNLT